MPNQKEYWSFDLNTKTTTKICSAFSECHTLRVFPKYNSEKFPLIIAREHECVTVINVKKMQAIKLIKAPYKRYFSTDNWINFCGEKEGEISFVTIVNDKEVTRYSIEATAIQAFASL